MTELSPVVMVVPCADPDSILVVGDTLQDFLALGSVIGFSFLEQLIYDFDKTLEYLFDYEAFIKHCYRGEAPPDEDLSRLGAERQLLQEFSAVFGLKPWLTPRAKFERFQQTWTPFIQLPCE